MLQAGRAGEGLGGPTLSGGRRKAGGTGQRLIRAACQGHDPSQFGAGQDRVEAPPPSAGRQGDGGDPQGHLARDCLVGRCPSERDHVWGRGQVVGRGGWRGAGDEGGGSWARVSPGLQNPVQESRCSLVPGSCASISASVKWACCSPVLVSQRPVTPGVFLKRTKEVESGAPRGRPL